MNDLGDEDRFMRWFGISLAILGAAFVVSIGVAMAGEPFWASLRAIASSRWGMVTLFDLGIGLAFVGTWIAMMERRVWPTIGWLICLLCVGNLATVAYLLVRLRRVDAVTAVFIPSFRRVDPNTNDQQPPLENQA